MVDYGAIFETHQFYKHYKSNLASINFYLIEVHDVKYLPCFLDGDVDFVLSPLPLGVPGLFR